MTTSLNEAAFASLLAILAARATACKQETGRDLAGPRDVIDMLVASASNDPFWSELERWQAEQAVELGLRGLRELLPDAPFPPEMGAEECLVALGTTAPEATAILAGIEQNAVLESSLRAAFEQLPPDALAARLERAVDGRGDAAALKGYVDSASVRSRRAWLLASLIGGGVLLVAGGMATCAATMVLYKGITL